MTLVGSEIVEIAGGCRSLSCGSSFLFGVGSGYSKRVSLEPRIGKRKKVLAMSFSDIAQMSGLFVKVRVRNLRYFSSH